MSRIALLTAQSVKFNAEIHCMKKFTECNDISHEDVTVMTPPTAMFLATLYVTFFSYPLPQST